MIKAIGVPIKTVPDTFLKSTFFASTPTLISPSLIDERPKANLPVLRRPITSIAPGMAAETRTRFPALLKASSIATIVAVFPVPGGPSRTKLVPPRMAFTASRWISSGGERAPFGSYSPSTSFWVEPSASIFTTGFPTNVGNTFKSSRRARTARELSKEPTRQTSLISKIGDLPEVLPATASITRSKISTKLVPKATSRRASKIDAFLSAAG